jgi:SAM-dependent methyltransferase
MKLPSELFHEVLECPACGTPRDRSKSSQSFQCFTQSGNGREYLHPDFMVIECVECSMLYKSSVPSEKVLAEYYQSLDTAYEDVDYLFPTDEVIVDYLHEQKDPQNILDFGCGTGRILSSLSDRHVKYGIEINPAAVATASSRGIKIIDESALHTDYKGFFDVIILTDVYEHLLRPFSMLAQLLEAVRNGGVIIISTGLADKVKSKALIGNYWYFQLFSHLQMLSFGHVRWLEKKLPVREIFSQETSHYKSSLETTLKRKAAESIFSWRNSNGLGSRVLNLLPGEIGTKWKYPVFDMYNRDHIVLGLQKTF